MSRRDLSAGIEEDVVTARDDRPLSPTEISMNARFKPTPEKDDGKSSPKAAAPEHKAASDQAMGAFVLGEKQYGEFVAYMQNPGEPNEKWSAVAQRMQEYREKKKSR
jgi:hypothetical protein